MPLQPVTRDFLAMVERETGYPVRILEEPNLQTLARVQIARGNVPAHIVSYKPSYDETLDYMICYECGFVLRLFEPPPAERFDLTGAARGRAEVLAALADPAGKLAKYGMLASQLAELSGIFFDGLITHLRTVPVGLRVAEWLAENYPELRAGQRATVLKEIAEARATLQPEVRDLTPDRVFAATQAINAAYGQYWADAYQMRELATPWQTARFDRAGRVLLDFWRTTRPDPRHDRALIDGWAETLGIAAWLEWTPYAAP